MTSDMRWERPDHETIDHAATYLVKSGGRPESYVTMRGSDVADRIVRPSRRFPIPSWIAQVVDPDGGEAT